MVVIVIYYLSVLCVSKYQHILDIVTREKKHKDRKSGVKSFTPQMPPRSGSMAKEEVPRPSDSGEVPRPAEEWEKSLGFLPDFRESAQPSLTIMLSSAVDISDHVKVSLKLVGQLLCDLLVEYKSLLGKVLVCEDGEVLLTDGEWALIGDRMGVLLTDGERALIGNWMGEVLLTDGAGGSYRGLDEEMLLMGKGEDWLCKYSLSLFGTYMYDLNTNI